MNIGATNFISSPYSFPTRPGLVYIRFLSTFAAKNMVVVSLSVPARQANKRNDMLYPL